MTIAPGVLSRLHRIHRQLADLRERLARGPRQVAAAEAATGATYGGFPGGERDVSLRIIAEHARTMTVMIAGLLWRRWIHHPVMAPTAGEIVVLGLMVFIAAIIIGVLHPWAATLQAEAFAIKDEAARKAAFEAFFKLHMPVRALYMVNLCLGIVLMGVRVNHTLRVSKGQV